MNQDESEIRADVPKPLVKIRVVVAPRAQPFDESMDSLYACCDYAKQAGIWMALTKVRRGAPGWHNLSPAVAAVHNDPTYTHLLSMADDMIYPIDIITRLVADDKDIVTGIYRKSNISRLEPAIFCDSLETWTKYYESKGVYETPYAAGHTMLIKRHVIEKMIMDYPELELEHPETKETQYGLFLPMIRDRVAFQDDWAFSIRARESGFKMYADFGVRCKHWCGDFLAFEPEVQDGK